MRLQEYLAYHAESARLRDIDPSYEMLRYLCDRFELSEEQRYWLAFLYAMTYSGAAVFYVYNEFPDAENVDLGRLQRWWVERGRTEILCQTDRRWVRSGNQFVPAVASYQKWLAGRSQTEHFAALAHAATPAARYDAIYRAAHSHLYSFGQFTLFLYLEALHTITPLQLAPTDLDLNLAHSCRNGLCYAYGLDHWLTENEAPMPAGGRREILAAWDDLRAQLTARVHPTPTVWQIETVTCAYKKFKRGEKRYLGYYIDRQGVEIAKMAARVPDGVAWRVLWQFRDETYAATERVELSESASALARRGVSASWKHMRHRKTHRALRATTGEYVLR